MKKIILPTVGKGMTFSNKLEMLKKFKKGVN